MDPTRRNALKSLAVAGASACACGTVSAREPKIAPAEAVGMLYDTTRCIGCKTCVVACKQANELPPDTHNPETAHMGAGLYDAPTDLNAVTKNVIKLYKDGDTISYMKAQCMHCVDPACAAACMLGSLHKDEVTGIVGYTPTYCVGCRYCMMACPFNVAKFEFHEAVPNIVKCELCRHRVKDAATTVNGFTRYPAGQGPACCEVCPREAVIYGRRVELLAEAKRRIADHPGRYFEDRIYGETDGGGTQVLYLSHVPFEALGLPNLGTKGVPETAMAVQDGIYWKLPFAAPAALYAVLAGVMYRNRRAGTGDARGEERP